MPANTDPLAHLRIASPCDASWEAMEGDNQARFCRHCQLHVYNLSGMSRRDAAALVRETEGRLCVRFYRRRDGTLLTDDCPVGLRAARRWLLAQIGSIVGLFGLLGLAAPLLRAERLHRLREVDVDQVAPLPTLSDWRDRLVERLDTAFPWLNLRPPLVAMGRRATVVCTIDLPPLPPAPRAKSVLSRRGRRRRRHPRSAHRRSRRG
jgi:hypothetical protein